MYITLSIINNVYKAKKCSIETMELNGYKLIKELFVYSSGFGAEDELALTQSQFQGKLTSILNQCGKVYATITNAGQFQVYVGLFKKTGKNTSKRIANNVLEINNIYIRIIRIGMFAIWIQKKKIEYKNGMELSY